jgi:iron complex transport system substrate-binding protein
MSIAKLWKCRTFAGNPLPVVLALAVLGAICWADPENKAVFTVKDDLGRTVSIPRKVERVISLQPEATRLIVALGCSEKLVGLDYFLSKFDRLFVHLFPGSRNIPVVAYEDTSVNLESVIRLNPDVIFASPYDAHIPDSLQTKTGTPVVAISSLGHLDKLLNETLLVGRVLGKSARAEQLVAYFKETTGRVEKVVRAVPRDGRPRAYLAFWSMLTRTPVSYDPVDIAGGLNVARSLAPSYPGSDGAVVSVENIVRWNPDIILVHGNYAPAERKVTIESVLGDRRLQSVRAVRDKRVFYTFGFWSWWDPAEVMVETLYLAKVFYPDRFRDLDLEREGNAIYKTVYGLENGYRLLSRTIACDEWLKK